MISYIGGKSRMAKWISGYIPDDIETYVEVFGGAFWVYVNGDVHTKPKLQKVIYNDFNRYMVNLFECCRTPQEFYDSMLEIKAQNEELEKWHQHNVYDEIEDDGQEAISTRWVITKGTDESKNKVIKAQLVARGFEEDSSTIRSDSPTITKENLRLVCAIYVSFSWQIHSMDIKCAFLQGMNIDRLVYLVPPIEANT